MMELAGALLWWATIIIVVAFSAVAIGVRVLICICNAYKRWVYRRKVERLFR